MTGFDNSAGYNANNQTQDAFSDMRLIGTGGSGALRRSSNGRMDVDSNGVERFPTTTQPQYVPQQGDLNAPPPGETTQANQPGAPTPGQYSYQRPQNNDGSGVNGNGTANNGQWRPRYGGDVGKTYRPGEAPPGSQGADNQPPQQNYPPQGSQGTPQGDGSTAKQGGGTQPTDYGTGGLPDPGEPVHDLNIFDASTAGGAGAYLMNGPVPKYLTKGADYALSRDLTMQKLFPHGEWLDKATNPNFAGKTRNLFDKSSAQWVKDHFGKPATQSEPAGASTTGEAAPEPNPAPHEANPASPASTRANSATGEVNPAAAGVDSTPAEVKPGDPAPIDANATPHQTAPLNETAAPASPLSAADEPIVEGAPHIPVSETTATLSEATAGAKTGILGDLGKVGEFLDKPGVRTFGEGAAVGASMFALDRFTPGNDHYGLGTVGMAAVFGGLPEVAGLPGDTKSKLLMAGGALVLGKTLNWLVPAETHPGLHNFLAPGMIDTGLMTGALFLPTADPRLKLAAVGGAYVLGRMGKVDGIPAAVGAAGIGYTAYRLTHNAELGVVLGVGSPASRLMHFL